MRLCVALAALVLALSAVAAEAEIEAGVSTSFNTSVVAPRWVYASTNGSVFTVDVVVPQRYYGVGVGGASWSARVVRPGRVYTRPVSEFSASYGVGAGPLSGCGVALAPGDGIDAVMVAGVWVKPAILTCEGSRCAAAWSSVAGGSTSRIVFAALSAPESVTVYRVCFRDGSVYAVERVCSATPRQTGEVTIGTDVLYVYTVSCSVSGLSVLMSVPRIEATTPIVSWGFGGGGGGAGWSPSWPSWGSWGFGGGSVRIVIGGGGYTYTIPPPSIGVPTSSIGISSPEGIFVTAAAVSLAFAIVRRFGVGIGSLIGGALLVSYGSIYNDTAMLLAGAAAMGGGILYLYIRGGGVG